MKTHSKSPLVSKSSTKHTVLKNSKQPTQQISLQGNQKKIVQSSINFKNQPINQNKPPQASKLAEKNNQIKTNQKPKKEVEEAKQSIQPKKQNLQKQKEEEKKESLQGNNSNSKSQKQFTAQVQKQNEIIMNITKELSLAKSPPKNGDWLSTHKEEGQTIEEFNKQYHLPVTPQKNKIYFLPLDSNMEHLRLKRFCEAFFYPLQVEVMKPIDIRKLNVISRMNSWSDKIQYQTGSILKILPQYLPKDAYCMIAITLYDLYPGDNWNYVFGWATYNIGVGVFSFCRFADDTQSESLILNRACKILCHETGHMFNLHHCIFNECLMCGLNGLYELDTHPFNYCIVCFTKFHSVLQFDMLERCKRLSAISGEYRGEFLTAKKYYDTLIQSVEGKQKIVEEQKQTNSQ